MSELLVTIPVADYTARVAEAEKARIVEDGIINSAKLSFSRDRLIFDDEVISAIMQSVIPIKYDRKLAELKGEKGEIPSPPL